MERSTELATATKAAYRAFAKYENPGNDFCTFCYDKAEIAYFKTTAIREIAPDAARRLVWEAADHWESSEVYRHFLPRILNVLAPPTSCDDIYPAHLFEVLSQQTFAFWPEYEQSIVLGYLEAMNNVVATSDPEDAREWSSARAKLGIEQITLT